MSSPVLTTEGVIKALSNDWQPITALIYKLQIKEMMDARFLQIKLKDLERKKLILVETKNGKKHFKLSKLDDIAVDLEEDLYWTTQEFWDEQDVIELNDYPRSQENIDFINSIVENLLEKISNMDTLDEKTMMDVETNILGLCSLGSTYHKHGDNQLAIDFYESALKLDAVSGEDLRKDLLKDIGNIFFEESNHQEAIKYYENALELSTLEEVSPFNREVLFNLGTSYSNINQPEKAILSFEKLAEHDPELDIVWSALGLAYSANNQFVEAVECFEIALQFNPSDEDITNKLDFAVDQMKKNQQPALGESPQELQDENIKSVLSKDDIRIFWKELIDKFDELIKLTKSSYEIQIKSFINDEIKPYFKKTSKKKIKKLKKNIEKHIVVWPEEKREEFYREYLRTIKRYEDLQPPEWKKYGSMLMKIIPVLR